MKSLSASIVTAALLVAGVAAQDFQINTPNPPTQCVPARFTWSGGQGAITPGGVPGAAALQQYPGLTGTAFTWPTNITAGTSIGLTLTDATGANGPDSSCLTGGSTPPPSSDTTSPSTGPTTTPGGTSPSAGSTTPGTSPTSRATTTSPTSSGSDTAPTGGSSDDNGALSNVASMGVVGILGAVAAAFLA
ncbi:hypothetical protein C8Q76DRAFT_818486 [Earliella scabrosa]|nr:hypothetical protein C8Q76DRAFT_818486 [Earliella scabrosa]